MVREGWALAYVKYSSAYVSVEEQAERDRADYGKAHSLRLGIGVTATTRRLSSERSAFTHNRFSLPRSATEGAPSAECVIKGNVNQNGERIYHVPGQEFYDKVRMDIGKDKRWFCTPEEAEAAGWRRALR